MVPMFCPFVMSDRCRISAISWLKICCVTITFRSYASKMQIWNSRGYLAKGWTTFSGLPMFTHPRARVVRGSHEPSTVPCNSRGGLPLPWRKGRTFKPNCDGWHRIEACSSTFLPFKVSCCCFSSEQPLRPITSFQLATHIPLKKFANEHDDDHNWQRFSVVFNKIPRF